MDGAALYWVGNLLLGLAVGALGTLIGAGGGFILVPVLLLLHPGESPEAIATLSLAVIFFNAFSGTLAYARMRRIDYRAGVVFSLATVPGAAVGAYATEFLARGTFNAIMGIVLLCVAAALLRWPVVPGRKSDRQSAAGSAPEATGPPHPRRYSLTIGMAISLVVGFVSSLLGIGGGIIHVPALVYVLGFPVHVATATSHFILAVMALVGTLVHLFLGQFTQAYELLPLAIGVILGAQLGASVSRRVHGRWIVRVLGAALAIVGIRLLAMALL